MYLSHAWLKDGKVVIGNAAGEILILDSNCEYLSYIPISLDSFQVTYILPYERGFIVGGSRGRVLIFDTVGEERRPEYQMRERMIITDKRTSACVKGLSLTYQTEEFLVIAMDNS